MKHTSWIMALLLAVSATLVAAQPQTAQPAPSKEQCLEMDEADTSDVLAIPLDESADEQCEELDKLEQGRQK